MQKPYMCSIREVQHQLFPPAPLISSLHIHVSKYYLNIAEKLYSLDFELLKSLSIHRHILSCVIFILLKSRIFLLCSSTAVFSDYCVTMVYSNSACCLEMSKINTSPSEINRYFLPYLKDFALH